MIVRGEASKSLIWRPLTLHRQLELTAAAHGDRVALIGPDRRLTWAEVHTEARRFARGLTAAGVGKGDHIAVWLPNQIEWVLAWLGASHVGAVVVPINTRYKLEETRYILNQSDSRLLFLRGSFLGIDYAPMLAAVAPGNGDGSCPELRLAIGVGEDPPTGSMSYDMFLENGAVVGEDQLDQAASIVEPDDATIIVYTSGTTGRPKARSTPITCYATNSRSRSGWRSAAIPHSWTYAVLPCRRQLHRHLSGADHRWRSGAHGSLGPDPGAGIDRSRGCHFVQRYPDPFHRSSHPSRSRPLRYQYAPFRLDRRRF